MSEMTSRQTLKKALNSPSQSLQEALLEQSAVQALVEISEALTDISNALPQVAQGVGISGEIARAASIYRDALADGRLPLKAVMKELNLTKPTASRRIRAARDMGLIPEKRRGVTTFDGGAA